MKKLIIFFLLLSISLVMVSAENSGMVLNIKNNTLTIEGYVVTEVAGRVNAGFFSNVDVSLNNDIIMCDSIQINETNITKTYYQNCSLNINITRDIPFIFDNNKTAIIDIQLQEKYENCLVDKKSCEKSLETCSSDYYNFKDFESNFTKCSSDLQVCRNDKTNLEGSVNTLQEEQDDTKNSKYIWAICAAGIVIVFFMYKEGKIGGPKVHRDEDSYNLNQAA